MDLSRDWAYIEQIASERLAHNKTERHVSDYGETIETIGAAGELAARRFFGISERLHTQFDQGTDFAIGKIRVDVKATSLHRGIQTKHLQWPIWKEIKSDIVLMVGVSIGKKTGAIIGYAYRDEIEGATVNPDRQFVCHEIPISELHPAWELLIDAAI